MSMKTPQARAAFRKLRTRRKIMVQTLNGRPRLSVFRSSKHIYAQIVDDVQGKTLAAASTVELDKTGKVETAKDEHREHRQTPPDPPLHGASLGGACNSAMTGIAPRARQRRRLRPAVRPRPGPGSDPRRWEAPPGG